MPSLYEAIAAIWCAVGVVTLTALAIYLERNGGR